MYHYLIALRSGRRYTLARTLDGLAKAVMVDRRLDRGEKLNMLRHLETLARQAILPKTSRRPLTSAIAVSAVTSGAAGSAPLTRLWGAARARVEKAVV